MEITVNDLLNLKGFENAEIIAGSKGADQIVRNAFLMEVPDIIPYIQEESLLITTLYPIYNDKEAKKNLIPQLKEKNISGICIKPHRYVEEIPESMIEQAEELNFPLIKLPKHSNLSSLISELLSLSVNKDLVSLEFENYMNEKIMNFFLEDFDARELIDEFAKSIKSYLILLDYNLEIKKISKNYENHQIHLEEVDSENRLDIFVDGEKLEEDSYEIISLEDRNLIYGYLIVKKYESKNWNRITERFSRVLVSSLSREGAVFEKENQDLIEFIQRLLKDQSLPEKELVAQAEELGWKLNFPKVIANIKLLDFDLEHGDYDRQIRDLKDDLLKKYFVYKNEMEVVYFEGSLLVFIHLKEDIDEIIEFFKKIRKQFEYYGETGIILSRKIESVSEIPKAYTELLRKMETAQIMTEGSFVYDSNAFEVIDLIREIDDLELLKNYVNKKIGKVIAYDNNHHLKLLDTLEAGIKRNFNLRKTSEDMYLHYNTLRYRVDKLNELGVDINDGKNLSEISLAYDIYKWLKVKGKME